MQKYGVVDEQAELRRELIAWTSSVAGSNPSEQHLFHGGDAPDAADLWVYGMLTAMNGMGTLAQVLRDVQGLHPWFCRMEVLVNSAAGKPKQLV